VNKSPSYFKLNQVMTSLHGVIFTDQFFEGLKLLSKDKLDFVEHAAVQIIDVSKHDDCYPTELESSGEKCEWPLS